MSDKTDALKTWLAQNGFKVAANPMRHELNDCEWYAYRRLATPARDCECNDKPPQIIVKPHSFEISERVIESAEVEVTGEQGNWWNLTAYGIRCEELPGKIAAIEADLIAAWNAISRAGEA
jgi:hypothetical protein